jgi:hypothetical protein
MDLGELRARRISGTSSLHKRHARYEQLDAELHALIQGRESYLCNP